MNEHEVTVEAGTSMDVEHHYQFNVSVKTLINLLHVDYNMSCFFLLMQIILVLLRRRGSTFLKIFLTSVFLHYNLEQKYPPDRCINEACQCLHHSFINSRHFC